MEFTGQSNLLDAREALKKDAKRFVITQGSNGAMIYDGDTFIDIEPYKVNAIDTNGGRRYVCRNISLWDYEWTWICRIW